MARAAGKEAVEGAVNETVKLQSAWKVRKARQRAAAGKAAVAFRDLKSTTRAPGLATQTTDQGT